MKNFEIATSVKRPFEIDNHRTRTADLDLLVDAVRTLGAELCVVSGGEWGAALEEKRREMAL